MTNFISPHNLRWIFRMIIALLILASFGMAVAGVDKSGDQVKGVSDDKQFISAEIDRTLKVVEKRPDYTAAWIKLSVLYEQIGDSENSKRAIEKAKRLDQDIN